MNRNVLAFIVVFLWSMQAQATLTARLDRTQIVEGETVRLQVESDGQASGSPDTAPLEKDFDVLGVSSGSQVNIINGHMDARTTWSITLAPKRGGNLIIPSLELNGEKTPQLSLQVSNAPVSAASAGGKPIFIETEVDRNDPYVQGMVRYKVRLFSSVRLAEGRLSEPSVDNALIRRLGKERNYSVERNGRRYQVVERQYAVIPQTSSELTLPAPVLDARVPDNNGRRRSPFDDPFFSNMLGATKQVRLRGKERTLQVRPRPSSAVGAYWLPAESVELSENWRPENGKVHVGEPLTRTITIRARGLSGEQLPDLQPDNMAGFKAYPDRAKAESRDTTQGIEGEKSRSIAFVPTKAGRFVLPAVRLHWWDVEADKERVAELPEHAVEILPAASGQTVAEMKMPPKQPESAAEPPSPRIEKMETTNIRTEGAGLWPWVSLLFASLWLATLYLWWRDRGIRVKLAPSTGTDEISNRTGEARRQYLAACKKNDPRLARRHLLEWSAAHWLHNPPIGLDELAKRINDDRVTALLVELDKVVYSDSANSWNGGELAKSLSRLPKDSLQQKRKHPLPDLYPS